LIPTGERSGLQTPIATTESVSLCVQHELLTAFLELENALGSDFDERFDKCRITFI
jgi:hypothetical protein